MVAAEVVVAGCFKRMVFRTVAEVLARRLCGSRSIATHAYPLNRSKVVTDFYDWALCLHKTYARAYQDNC